MATVRERVPLVTGFRSRTERMEQDPPSLPGGQRHHAAGRIRAANSRGDREAVASDRSRGPRRRETGFLLGRSRPWDREPSRRARLRYRESAADVPRAGRRLRQLRLGTVDRRGLPGRSGTPGTDPGRIGREDGLIGPRRGGDADRCRHSRRRLPALQGRRTPGLAALRRRSVREPRLGHPAPGHARRSAARDSGTPVAIDGHDRRPVDRHEPRLRTPLVATRRTHRSRIGNERFRSLSRATGRAWNPLDGFLHRPPRRRLLGCRRSNRQGRRTTAKIPGSQCLRGRLGIGRGVAGERRLDLPSIGGPGTSRTRRRR